MANRGEAPSTDVRFLVMIFRYFASIADKLESEFFDQGSMYSATIYKPHGVCAGSFHSIGLRSMQVEIGPCADYSSSYSRNQREKRYPRV